MVEEELINLIADSIYRDLIDNSEMTIQERIQITAFHSLPISKQNFYQSMAHNIVAIVDDYYDAELDEDSDEEDVDLDDAVDDGYPEHLFWEE